jgi:hypothetical protein
VEIPVPSEIAGAVSVGRAANTSTISQRFGTGISQVSFEIEVGSIEQFRQEIDTAAPVFTYLADGLYRDDDGDGEVDYDLNPYRVYCGFLPDGRGVIYFRQNIKDLLRLGSNQWAYLDSFCYGRNGNTDSAVFTVTTIK